MRTALIIGLVLTGLCAVTSTGWAYTCTPTAGCTFEVGYTEPTSLTNAQPITDLTSCAVSYTIATDGGAPGAAKVVAVPASKPSGGGVITKSIAESALAVGHIYTAQATVACNSTAFGTGGAAPSNPLTMNNGVSPNPPVGSTLK